MRLSFMRSPTGRPDHTIDFADAAALRRWLMQDRSGAQWYIAVHREAGKPPACVRGECPGNITFTWVRGGWNTPQSAADLIWQRAIRDRDAADLEEQQLEQFLGGMSAFIRGAIYGTPAAVRK